MFKKSKIFLAIALVLLMSFTSITAVLATNLDDNRAIVTDDEDSPVQATITKHIRMPINTATPNVTFTFNVEKVSVDGRTTATDLATMPDLDEDALIVTFTADDTANAASGTPGLISVKKETGNLFDGVDFPHAGIFIYKITENRPATTTPEGVFEDGHNVWYYSRASYELIVHVANHSNGTTRYVRALGTHQRINDDNETVEGVKVDPTPGGYEDLYSFSQMEFLNDFIHTDAPIILDPTLASTLFVSKEVEGDMGDRTMLFNFSIDLKTPPTLRGGEEGQIPTYYRAFILEKRIVEVDDGDDEIIYVVIDPADNNVAPARIGGTAGNRYIMVSPNSDEPTAFSLRHNQRLAFIDVPVGSEYTVTETAALNYDTSIVVRTPGGTPSSATLTEALSTGVRNVGRAGSSAEFTNERVGVTPTGLNLNDLPFIGLIVLALGSLTIFVVLKVRKRNYE